MNKKLLCLATAVFMVVGVAATLWAIQGSEIYNRPNPLMDYTPQEVGYYDTMYQYLYEQDCRGCHGNSLADRHHHTVYVLRDQLCTKCHAVDPDPDDPGIEIIHDCTTAGCHSWPDDIYAPPDGNRWHHNTDMSDSENCTTCHSSAYLDEIGPFISVNEVPVADMVVAPTPFSCENCHWLQDPYANTFGGSPPWVPSGNPPWDDPGVDCPDYTTAGHPSTYDHYGAWDEFIGYYEYGKRIMGNVDNHMMDLESNITAECYTCHGSDPNTTSWVYDDPDLIRYCEKCHGIRSLHAIRAHIGDTTYPEEWTSMGWKAAGFHTDPAVAGSISTTYRAFINDDTKNEMCWGCHGDGVPPWTDDPGTVPVISANLEPSAGCPGVIFVIRGSGFGDESTAERWVETTPSASPDWPTAKRLPIYSWNDTRIEVVFPGWLVPAGNYRVRVVNEYGASNPKVFSLYDCGAPTSISPDSGACGTLVFLEQLDSKFVGIGPFAVSPPQAPGVLTINDGGGAGIPDMCVTGVVDFVATEGTYSALLYKRWNTWQIRVYFQDFFEDQGATMEDRNFVQDGDEPTIGWCEIPGVGGGPLGLGDYSVFIRYVYFWDNNEDGVLDTGDTIYQVVSVDEMNFELTNTPYLFKTNPTAVIDNGPGCRPLLKLFGLAFGPTQGTGQVFMGSEAQYTADTGRLQTQIRSWQNTRIKFKVNAPGAGTPCTAWTSNWEGKKRGVWVVNSDGMKSRWLRVLFLSG